jgi:hypothetical protein
MRRTWHRHLLGVCRRASPTCAPSESATTQCQQRHSQQAQPRCNLRHRELMPRHCRSQMPALRALPQAWAAPGIAACRAFAGALADMCALQVRHDAPHARHLQRRWRRGQQATCAVVSLQHRTANSMQRAWRRRSGVRRRARRRVHLQNLPRHAASMPPPVSAAPRPAGCARPARERRTPALRRPPGRRPRAWPAQP